MQVIQVWNFLTLKNCIAEVLAFFFFLQKYPWECRCKILINLVSNYIFSSDLHYRPLEYSALVVHLQNSHWQKRILHRIQSDAGDGNEEVSCRYNGLSSGSAEAETDWEEKISMVYDKERRLSGFLSYFWFSVVLLKWFPWGPTDRESKNWDHCYFIGRDLQGEWISVHKPANALWKSKWFWS